MRILTFFSILTLYGGLSLSLQAAPVAITAMRSTADTYSLFFVDGKGLRNGRSTAQAMLTLTDQLAVLTPPLKPCFASGDLNATNIRCGTGINQMQLGVSEIFGYNLETLLVGVPVTLERGVRQLMASNFMSPNQFTIPATPGDSAGRVARIHFTGQMAQFGMLVDPGLFNSLNTIQFIVNGHALSPVALTGGVVQFVGVEDAQGFTDLTVIASGNTRAFVADKLAFLPLAKF